MDDLQKGENGRFVEGREWTICRRERMDDLLKGENERFAYLAQIICLGCILVLNV